MYQQTYKKKIWSLLLEKGGKTVGTERVSVKRSLTNRKKLTVRCCPVWQILPEQEQEIYTDLKYHLTKWDNWADTT